MAVNLVFLEVVEVVLDVQVLDHILLDQQQELQVVLLVDLHHHLDGVIREVQRVVEVDLEDLEVVEVVLVLLEQMVEVQMDPHLRGEMDYLTLYLHHHL